MSEMTYNGDVKPYSLTPLGNFVAYVLSIFIYQHTTSCPEKK